MVEREAYLDDKQAQINKWIAELARLDALCREAGEEVRIKFIDFEGTYHETVKP